ncbi:MAG TPA: HAMP domain-containing sensor histidine kinase [Vicinamibacterales bacterium]|nr:HAMP domain-containing sensor histidine kinase [Vicinamibacterales bacterium]
MRRQRAVSVGRRLAALVGVQVATAAILLAVAFGGYGRLASDLAFLHRYVLARIEGISDAMEEAAQLKFAAEAARNTPPDLHQMKGWARDVRHFLDRYRTEWAVAGNTSEDALRFRATLERSNRGGLAADETAAMNDVGNSLERVEARLASPAFNGQVAASIENDARDLRTALRRLLRVQVAFIDVENAATEARSRETYWWMSVVGLLGLFGSLALGLQVHQAIAPRIRRLVQEVQRFKELGVHQRVLEEGCDEIAILANALDAGFAAIAAQDRERERFLALVAHELKTPMTSILGFTELALSRPESPQVRARALDVVRSHASRLGRLIDDLLLAASTRSGALPFRPQSVDAACVAVKVAAEVTITMPGRCFDVDVARGGRLLADEHLLTQAVWTLLTYAAAIAETGRKILVRLVPGGARLRLEVLFDAPSVPVEEMERAFAPFASVQYEGGSAIRNAVGLFLCREVARVHGGTLFAMNPTDVQRMLVLELPA